MFADLPNFAERAPANAGSVRIVCTERKPCSVPGISLGLWQTDSNSQRRIRTASDCSLSALLFGYGEEGGGCAVCVCVCVCVCV